MSRRVDPVTALVRMSVAVRARIAAEKAPRDYWARQWPYDAESVNPDAHKPGACWTRFARDEHDTDACCPVCAGSLPLLHARMLARRRAAAAIRSAVAVGVRLGKDTTPCR